MLRQPLLRCALLPVLLLLLLLLLAASASAGAAAGRNCTLGPRSWLQRLDEWPPRAAGNHFCAEVTWLQVLRTYATRWGASDAYCGDGAEEKEKGGATSCECLRLRAQVVAARLNAAGPFRAANLSHERLATIEQAEEMAGTACCNNGDGAVLDTRRAGTLFEALREFNGEGGARAAECMGTRREALQPRQPAEAGQGVMRADGAYARFVYESFANRVMSQSGVVLVACIVVGSLVFILAARLRTRFVLQHQQHTRRRAFAV